MKHFVFHSFDEFAASVQHVDMRLTLSSRQQTNWYLDYLSLGNVSIQWGQHGGPNVAEGSSSARGLTLFVPLHNANAIIANGRRMQSGAVMVLDPGAEFCVAATGVNRWASIFVSKNQFPAFDVSRSAGNRTHNILLPTAAGHKLRRFVDALGAATGNVSNAWWSTPAATTTRHELAEAIREVLGWRKSLPASIGRQAFCRNQITSAALQALEQHPDHHLSVTRLSTIVGVSERTLRMAFEEYFGVAPAKYLKGRRLHQARNLLKAADPNTTGVTEIALGLGILELGRFSHDYKQLFNELPSATLRNNDAPSRAPSHLSPLRGTAPMRSKLRASQ